VCDGVFCPHKIQDYISIEYYFKNFEPLTFEDISEIIDSNEHRMKIKQSDEAEI